MSGVTTFPASGQEAFLFGLVSECQRVMEQVELGDTHVQAVEGEISRLHMKAAEMFMLQSVTAEPLEQSTSAITAVTTTLPHLVPFHGWDPGGEQVVQDGILLQTHPRRAIGTVTGINLRDAQLAIRPRRWSPYRLGDGRFLVRLLDEEGQPQVKLDLDFDKSAAGI